MNRNIANPVQKKPYLPLHAWILGVVFFLYGLASAFDFVMSLTQGEAYYRASGMTDSQVAYFLNIPVWAAIGWTLSVWGGFLGSLGLLLRWNLTADLFSASLLGSVIYILYTLVLSAGKESMGVLWLMPIIIAIFTVFMIFYTRSLFKK